MEHFYHTFIRMGGNHAQQLVCLLPYPHGLMWFCIHVDIVAFIVQDIKEDRSLSSASASKKYRAGTRPALEMSQLLKGLY
jgi:hypothetical protein